MAKIDSEKIEEILSRGVEEIIERESLIKKLSSGKKLRVKHGIDPTVSDLHLGNAVILWKLKKIQDLGHKIILIIGDFTARIGDPSGRLTARRMLTENEIRNNMKTYEKQVGKILNLNKTEMIYNSRHLSKLSFAEIYRISHFFTANQMLERDMFQERKKKQKPVWFHEFFYPIFQAYDSVAVKADLEVGGNDQLFNMLMGRQLQPHFNQPPQDIMTMKLLIGTDGEKKMSKSFGNYIGIQETPDEQYGKIMSIKDEMISQYFELCTKKDFKIKKINPRDAKAKLAYEIVSIYHGATAAKKAEEEFNKIFKKKELPSKMPTINIAKKNIGILDLLVKTKLASSKSEARRLVVQNGVKIDGKVENDWQKMVEVKKEIILQVGKRKFVKVSKVSFE